MPQLLLLIDEADGDFILVKLFSRCSIISEGLNAWVIGSKILSKNSASAC